MNINKIKGKRKITHTLDNSEYPIYKKGEWFKIKFTQFDNFKWIHYDGIFYVLKAKPTTIEGIMPKKVIEGTEYVGWYISTNHNMSEQEFKAFLREERINDLLK